MKKDGPAAAAFATGTRLYKAARYVQAIEAFQRAYALKPHYLMICNIARCRERLSELDKAAGAYRRCLKEGGGQSRQASKIRAAFKKVQSQLGWVTITCPGAPGTAVVDSEVVGKTPILVPLNPGPHLLQVRRGRARSIEFRIEIGAGEARTLQLVPEKVQKRKPVPKRRRAVRRPVDRDRDTDRRGISQVWFWIGAGLTLGLGVATAVFGVRTMQANTDYSSHPTEEGFDRVIDRRLLTNVLVGLTAGVASTTAVLFFFTDFKGGRGDEDHAATAPRSFGIGLSGRF